MDTNFKAVFIKLPHGDGSVYLRLDSIVAVRRQEESTHVYQANDAHPWRIDLQPEEIFELMGRAAKGPHARPVPAEIRDPRHDPRPGDVLIDRDLCRHTVEVLEDIGSVVRCDVVTPRGTDSRESTISAWRVQMADAEVIAHGE